MRKYFIAAVLCLLAIAFSGAAFSAEEDVAQNQTCKYCSMDREKFGHSRFYIEFEDKTSLATCSIRCAAAGISVSLDKKPAMYGVGDYNSKKLINAETATWVIGGTKPPVMSKRAKWAFENRQDADNFIKESGGEIADMNGAFKAAYEDMGDDVKMIRERRAAKRMQQAAEMKQ